MGDRAPHTFFPGSCFGRVEGGCVHPAPSPFPTSEFGAAVAIDEDALLIGHPGTAESRGIVVEYTWDEVRRAWTQQDRIAPGMRTIGDRFGSSLAFRENELLVGAPGADEGRGGVHRFVRNRSEDNWQAVEIFSVRDVEPGFALGADVAIGRNTAVAGAPGADGGKGRVAVFSRPPNGRWGEGDWLSLASELRMVTGEEVPCAAGQADQFECSAVDLLAFLPLSELGLPPGSQDLANGITDVWGWMDPETEREYALVARTGGASVVDITDPSRPVYSVCWRRRGAPLRTSRSMQTTPSSLEPAIRGCRCSTSGDSGTLRPFRSP